MLAATVFGYRAVGELSVPGELVEFVPYAQNPVFAAADAGHWDDQIRERGWILREDGVYHLWYTGYAGTDRTTKYLGYATSTDGLTWRRYADAPIYRDTWVEDVCVVHVGGTYYMFAEGENDRAHMLTSTDRVHWTENGALDIRMTNGDAIAPGPYGTPAVLYEDGTWYLFYERNDEAVWLAKSTDAKVWTHVQDGPVLKPGPGDYDRGMIAVNQVIKYEGTYYAYYHGLTPNTKPQLWTTSVAASVDMVHWEKYKGNPIIRENASSAELVQTENGWRLYTMHPSVCAYVPKRQPTGRPGVTTAPTSAAALPRRD